MPVSSSSDSEWLKGLLRHGDDSVGRKEHSVLQMVALAVSIADLLGRYCHEKRGVWK